MNKILSVICVMVMTLLGGCKSHNHTTSTFFDRDLRIYSWIDYMPTRLYGMLCLFPNNTYVICYYDQLDLYSGAQLDRYWPSETELGTFVRDSSYMYCTTQYRTNTASYKTKADYAKHIILKEVGDDYVVGYYDYFSFRCKNEVDSIWLDWAKNNLEECFMLPTDPPSPEFVERHFIRRRPGKFDGRYKFKDAIDIVTKYENQ